MDLLNHGNLRRAVSPTEANQVSSRSHAVMQVTIHQKDKTADVRAAVKVGKLSLIDLAGSGNCPPRLTFFKLPISSMTAYLLFPPTI